MKTIFMYSGQGGQYYHMGRQLFYANEAFHEHLENIENDLQDRHGSSVLSQLYAPTRSKSESFDDAVLSSLAIFAVEWALTETLADHNVIPDAVLGVSMGGYAAMCAAGATDYLTGLDLLIQQSNIMKRGCPSGAMLAVIAPPEVLERNLPLAVTCEVAAVNSATHFVITLLRSHLGRVETFLGSQRIAFQRLPVSLPYHSQWLDPVKEEVLAAGRNFQYNQTSIPVDLCFGRKLEGFDTDALWKAVRQPIRFREAVLELEREAPNRYVDVGTSGTLATLIKYALPAQSRSSVHTIITPIGQEERNFKNLLEAIAPYSRAGY